jgi:hypothetical protein
VSGTAMIRGDRITIETATPIGGVGGLFEGAMSRMEINLTGVEHVKIAERAEDDRACRVRLNRR